MANPLRVGKAEMVHKLSALLHCPIWAGKGEESWIKGGEDGTDIVAWCRI